MVGVATTIVMTGVSLLARCSVVVVLVLATACAGPSYRRHVLEDIQLRAQERIVHRARLDFERGDHRAVIRRLTRMLKTAPATPLRDEALWFLARSYEEQEEWREALARYRALADSPSGGRYRALARERLAWIQRHLQSLSGHRLPVRAVRLRFHADAENHGGSWIRPVVSGGYNTVLIDLGCTLAERNSPASPWPTGETGARRAAVFEDRLAAWIQAVREKGLSVYVGVHLRCLGELHAAPPESWRDRRFHPASRTLDVSPFFDLFHPDYRTFLVQTLDALARLDLDGIVYLNDPPFGPYEGFSLWAKRAFQRAFGFPLIPRELFTVGRGWPLSDRSVVPTDGLGVAIAPEFWRWAGWKMRQRLNLLGMLARRLKEARPGLDVGIGVDGRGMQEPHAALVCASEDVLETARARFDFMMIVMERETQTSCWNARAGSAMVRALDEAQLGRWLDLVESPRHIWVYLPRAFPNGSAGAPFLTPARNDESTDRVGLVSDP